jgi:hypothetical protein
MAGQPWSLSERKVRLRGRMVCRLRRTSARNKRRLVTLTFASWNQVGEWLRRLESLRQVA